MEELELTINGEDRRVPAGWTVADLLDDLGVNREGVAVAADMKVVPRSEHASRPLRAGEKLEVIMAVGGG